MKTLKDFYTKQEHLEKLDSLYKELEEVKKLRDTVNNKIHKTRSKLIGNNLDESILNTFIVYPPLSLIYKIEKVSKYIITCTSWHLEGKKLKPSKSWDNNLYPLTSISINELITTDKYVLLDTEELIID